MLLPSFALYSLSIFFIFAYFNKETFLKNKFFLKFFFINLLFSILILIGFKVYKFPEYILLLHSSIMFLLSLVNSIDKDIFLK